MFGFMNQDRGPFGVVSGKGEELTVNSYDLERKVGRRVSVFLLDRGVQPVVAAAKRCDVFEQKRLVFESFRFDQIYCSLNLLFFGQNQRISRKQKRKVEAGDRDHTNHDKHQEPFQNRVNEWSFDKSRHTAAAA